MSEGLWRPEIVAYLDELAAADGPLMTELAPAAARIAADSEFARQWGAKDPVWSVTDLPAPEAVDAPPVPVRI